MKLPLDFSKPSSEIQNSIRKAGKRSVPLHSTPPHSRSSGLASLVLVLFECTLSMSKVLCAISTSQSFVIQPNSHDLITDGTILRVTSRNKSFVLHPESKSEIDVGQFLRPATGSPQYMRVCSRNDFAREKPLNMLATSPSQSPEKIRYMSSPRNGLPSSSAQSYLQRSPRHPSGSSHSMRDHSDRGPVQEHSCRPSETEPQNTIMSTFPEQAPCAPPQRSEIYAPERLVQDKTTQSSDLNPQAVAATSFTDPKSTDSALIASPVSRRRQFKETNNDETSASAGTSTEYKRPRAAKVAPKVLPVKYELCDVEDMVIIIADMISELIETNDNLPLQDVVLTRFHSRTPPGISVLDYLARLAKHATLTPPLLLCMVYYIDRLCSLYDAFSITTLTVHRFLITAATVAAKGLSDSFWNNSTYARVGGIKLGELGLLELEFLYRVDWRIVPNPEVLVDYYRGLVGRTSNFILSDDVRLGNGTHLVNEDTESSTAQTCQPNMTEEVDSAKHSKDTK